MEMTKRSIPPSEPPDKKLEELRRIRQELSALRSDFVEFCRVFLAAKFPFGRPSDRWRR
jgi:hypothetical protein